MPGTTFIPGAGAAVSRGIAAGAKFANARSNAKIANLRAKMIQNELDNFAVNEKTRQELEGAQAEGATANAELARTRADIAEATKPTVVRGVKAKLSAEEAEAAQRLASPDMSPEEIEAGVQLLMDSQGIAISEQKKVGPQLQAAVAQQVRELGQKQTQAEMQSVAQLQQLGQLVGTSSERAKLLGERQPSLKGFIDSALEENIRQQDLTKRGAANIRFTAGRMDDISRQIEGFQSDQQTLRESIIASELAGDDTTFAKDQLRGITEQVQNLSDANETLARELEGLLRGRSRTQGAPPPPPPPGEAPAAQVQFRAERQREGAAKLGRFDIIGNVARDPKSGEEYPVATLEQAQELRPGTLFVDNVAGELRTVPDPKDLERVFEKSISPVLGVIEGVQKIARDFEPKEFQKETRKIVKALNIPQEVAELLIKAFKNRRSRRSAR